MTQPSSPRRATAEDAASNIFGDLTTHGRNCHVGDVPNGRDFDPDCSCSLGYRRRWATAETQSAAWRKRAMEAEALPSTHDEAIRAEEREADAKLAETTYLEVGKGSLALRIAAAIRARASSPRPVPADHDPRYFGDGPGKQPRRLVTAEAPVPAPAPVRATGEPTDEMIEVACRAAYGKHWDGPADKMPNEAMKKVWRDYARKFLLAALALLPPGTVAPEGWPELIAAERTGCTVTLTFERDVTQAEFRRIGLLVEPAAPSPPASETA